MVIRTDCLYLHGGANQALAGWQGRAWDVVVDFDNTALASISIPVSLIVIG